MNFTTIFRISHIALFGCLIGYTPLVMTEEPQHENLFQFHYYH